MATIKDSLILSKLSGTLGGFVFRKYRKKVVVSRMPDMSRVVPTEKQKHCRTHFAAAVARTRIALRDPDLAKELHSRFASKARATGKSVYHLALQEQLSS